MRRCVPVALGLTSCSLALIGGTLTGCKYDADEPCGPGQVVKNGLCVCDEGRALMGNKCVEKAPAPVGGSSAPPATGHGAACTTNADCTDATYDTCITRNASSGYCSRTGCSGTCEAGYFCATDASPAYCKRTPTGEGVACTEMSDCEGKDASLCAMNPMTGTSSCVVPDCKAGGCSPAQPTCLDLSMFSAPNICVP